MKARLFGRVARFVVSGVFALGLFCASASAQHLKVTITNVSGGQTFTPIIVASHKAGVSLFTLGQPASTDLAHVAEAGDNSEIEATLAANPDVLDIADSGAALPPGQSVTLTVKAHGAFNHLSIAAMLVPTNDGFFSLNGVSVARVLAPSGDEPRQNTLVFFSPAYDAGTKLDDELCANIPGPPTVCTGTGFIPQITGPNFVFIHSGIHAIGDLKASVFDWKNPVAKITVTRVP